MPVWRWRAKRLLAHTTLPVQTIGSALDFAEATNFDKFFCKEGGNNTTAPTFGKKPNTSGQALSLHTSPRHVVRPYRKTVTRRWARVLTASQIRT